MSTCIYCGADIDGSPSSRIDPEGGRSVILTDEEWAAEAAFHNDGCEWVATRAHTLNEKDPQ